MRSTCAEPSLPTSASEFWLSVPPFDVTSPLRSALPSAKAEKEAGGSAAVSWAPGLLLLWRPGLTEEMGEKREEQRSLTGQKAEPRGMKFTLFLSGQEKRGKPFEVPDLKNNKTNDSFLFQTFGYFSGTDIFFNFSPSVVILFSDSQ